ncbi:unnamed protein product [Rhizoctonia solani]|uniref:Uncharacterized protein n=1 Tax=Rhizoctonia solani TaxID=456999 RepID=A0A8H3HSV4_9AGAM|nr:unnamed protein product [Rhizoctonia solani]
MKSFPNPMRRRSTAPEGHIPESMAASSGPATRPKPPSRSQSSGPPPIHRRSLKRLRKYYIANISPKSGHIQDQVILSASYYQSDGVDFIHLNTSGSQSGIQGVFLLESPQPNKGPGVPRLLRRFSQSNAMKSIGNMVPIAPNLGYFSVSREASGLQVNILLPTTPLDTITYQTPLPLDNLVVLTGKISSPRSRRSLDSPARTWFIPAVWEGLKRLKAFHENTPPADLEASSNHDTAPAGVQKLLDGAMSTFGDSLLLFHHKVLKIQQKFDHSMSANQERKNIVRQEIDERNQDITKTQANWHAAEQERENLRRKESLLRKQLSASNLTVH